MDAMGRRLFVGAFLLVGLLACDAVGQDDRTVERVMQLDDTAAYAFEHGNYQTALEALVLAQQLMPSSPRLFNIAVCHDRLGDRARAISVYRAYAEAEDVDAEGREQALARAEELQAELDEQAAEAAAREASRQAAAEAAARPLPVAPVPEPPAPTPLYRRWWLWAIVAGAVAAAGLAAGLALGLEERGPGAGDMDFWLP